MAFDLRPKLLEDPAESQISEGGNNATDNCVPTSASICMASLGYGDVEPQDYTNFEYGTGYQGTESFQAAADFIKNSGRYSGSPGITVEGPSDLAAAADAYGQQGFPMFAAFACDCATVRIGAGGACGHASLIAAFDGNLWAVWNVWTGFEQYFTSDELNAAYLGGLAVFHQTLFPGGATPMPQPFDIARRIRMLDASRGYVLDGKGGVHPIGGAPAISDGPVFNFDIARDLELVSTNPVQGFVLDGYGGVHPIAQDGAKPPALPSGIPSFVQ